MVDFALDDLWGKQKAFRVEIPQVKILLLDRFCEYNEGCPTCGVKSKAIISKAAECKYSEPCCFPDNNKAGYLNLCYLCKIAFQFHEKSFCVSVYLTDDIDSNEVEECTGHIVEVKLFSGAFKQLLAIDGCE